MDERHILNTVKAAIVSCGIKSTDKIEVSPLSNEIMLIAPDTDRVGAQALLKRILQNINMKGAGIGDYSRSLITSIATYPEDGTSDKELIDFARGEIRKQMTT